MKARIILGISAVLMTSTIALQPVKCIEKAAIGNTSAKVETWHEQTWSDKWIGTGFWQTRTEYTVNPQAANTTVSYENRKLCASSTNRTNVNQSVSYNYTNRVGHNVDASVKAKSDHFEAAVGYKFSYETTTSYTASMTVPAHQTYYVYQSDTRVRNQYTTYTKQPQRADNLTATKWVNNGSASSSSPLIKEYSGVHFDFTNSSGQRVCPS